MSIEYYGGYIEKLSLLVGPCAGAEFFNDVIVYLLLMRALKGYVIIVRDYHNLLTLAQYPVSVYAVVASFGDFYQYSERRRIRCS